MYRKLTRTVICLTWRKLFSQASRVLANFRILSVICLVVYMARDVMILMRANLFREPLEGGGPWKSGLFGPWNSTRGLPFQWSSKCRPQNRLDFQGPPLPMVLEMYGAGGGWGTVRSVFTSCHSPTPPELKRNQRRYVKCIRYVTGTEKRRRCED